MRVAGGSSGRSMWIIDDVVDGDSYQCVTANVVFMLCFAAHFAVPTVSVQHGHVSIEQSPCFSSHSQCWTCTSFSGAQVCCFCRFGSTQRLFSDKHLRIQSPAGDRIETVPFSVVSNCKMSMDEYHVFHGDRAKAKVPQITKHEVCSTTNAHHCGIRSAPDPNVNTGICYARQAFALVDAKCCASGVCAVHTAPVFDLHHIFGPACRLLQSRCSYEVRVITHFHRRTFNASSKIEKPKGW